MKISLSILSCFEKQTSSRNVTCIDWIVTVSYTLEKKHNEIITEFLGVIDPTDNQRLMNNEVNVRKTLHVYQSL